MRLDKKEFTWAHCFRDTEFNTLERTPGNGANSLLGWFSESWKKQGFCSVKWKCLSYVTDGSERNKGLRSVAMLEWIWVKGKETHLTHP